MHADRASDADVTEEKVLQTGTPFSRRNTGGTALSIMQHREHCRHTDAAVAGSSLAPSALKQQQTLTPPPATVFGLSGGEQTN